MLSKGMSNIYLKVTNENKLTSPKLRFSLVTGSVIQELQFTKISLNCKASSCNLEIRVLRAKLLAAFLLLSFLKEL